MIAERDLQDLLVQLARFYRANETNISASHVSKWKRQLLESDISALDRFFGLFLCCTPLNLNTGTSGHSSTTGLDCGPLVIAASAKSASAARARARKHWLPAGSNRLGRTSQPSQHQEGHSAIPDRDDDQLPIGIPGRVGSNSSNRSTPCSYSDANTTDHASPATGGTTPIHVASNDDDTFGSLTFSPSTRLLLESCKTDRGRFLREIEEARTALPTGQGWEAAIATKDDNADMHDRMKIYHRFECYNIYMHVVEAGYHTGTHWIRDMRTALANKLCQDFHQRFPSQKAANKSLNWVDQGYKFKDWASHFGNEATDLGYLIALPLDAQQELIRYTSRCTQDRMHAAIIKLKSMGIDKLVKDLELSELGNHIAATLKDMTGRKRNGTSEDAIEGPRKLPRLTPSSSTSASHVLAVHPCQNSGLPDTLAVSCDDACRSVAEAYAVPYNGPLDNMYLNQSARSGLLYGPESNAPMELLGEWCWDANYNEDLSSLEPLLAFVCNNVGSPLNSGQ
ncbi:hypothetical protein BDW72DRAFT_193745 [Aspergillus terricola var. indicus]